MLLDDIGDLLSTGGIGTLGSTSDYGIFLGIMPSQPSKVVSIQETGGIEPYRRMTGTAGNVVAERPRIQIFIRSDEYSTGREKANDAWKLIESLPEREINGTRYLYAEAVQSPFLIGRDDNARFLITFNVDVVKEIT